MDNRLKLEAVSSLLALERAHPRSSQWPAFVDTIIAAHPFCSFCGESAATTELVGHHILPYYKFWHLELVTDNILVVGETCTSGNHHLFCCHFGDYRKWNPDARELARLMLENRRQKLMTFEPIPLFGHLVESFSDPDSQLRRDLYAQAQTRMAP